MSNNENCNGVIFLATVLSKMSQMFSELNSIYLQAMLNKNSLNMRPEFSMSSLLGQIQKDQPQEKPIEIDEVVLESQQIEEKNEDEKYIQSKKKKQIKKKDQLKISDKVNKVNQKEEAASPPRPPPSSYLLFFKDHRASISEEYPNLNVNEINKIAAKCWKELTQQQKKPYHDKFNQEKSKYYEALKVYNQRKGQVDQSSPKNFGKKQKNHQSNTIEIEHPSTNFSKNKANRPGKVNIPDSNSDSSNSI